MPVQTFALAGNFSALVGEISRLRATIHANSDDGSWVNELDDEIKLGGALLTTAADGTFTVTLPTSSGTGLQYEVRAEYVDPATQTRKAWTSGWFDLTANANLADKANDSSLRVNPSLGAQLAARIDGYFDHEDVSGAVVIDPTIGTHVLDATAATAITIDDAPDGHVVTLLVASGANNVAVSGISDPELTDGAFASFVRIRGSWVLASAGSGASGGTPDSTPPSAVTTLAATGGEGQITATWAASTDPESTVHYRWRVWLTSGGATGAWTQTDSLTFTKTGLNAGAYTAEVYAYSAGGSTTPDTDAATVTAVPVSPRALKLSRSPLYYYPLDDTAGTTAPTNLGSGTGSASALAGVTFGSAGIAGTTSSASFNASSTGRINLPTAANLNGLSAFTVEILAVRTGGTVVVSSDNSDGNGYMLANSYYAIRGQYDFKNITNAGTLLTLTYDGTIARMYVDGVEFSTQAASGPLSVTGAPRLGTAADGSQGFGGTMAEFVVYTYCQTAAEVLATAQAHGLA